MDARAYLDQLIGHLIAELSAGGRATEASVLDQVEGAAAALAAQGLLEPSDVHRYHERALDALSDAGEIKRLSESQSSSHVTAMTATEPATAAAPTPRREVAPHLESVVAIGETTTLDDGRSLVLLSLNRWSSGFDVMFAMLGAEAPDLAAGRRDSVLDWDWSLTDDRGMRYGVHRAGGGGGGAIRWQHAHAVPALPPDARTLSVQVASGGTELLSTMITL